MYKTIILILCYTLPPIDNIYKGKISFGLIGKQDIEFKRIKKNTSMITLKGIINSEGYIYTDNYIKTINLYKNYKLDNNLKKIMCKYNCEIENPIYDNKKDEILFILKINMLKMTKRIELKNQRSSIKHKNKLFQ